MVNDMRPFLALIFLVMASPIWAFDDADLVGAYQRALSETATRYGTCAPDRRLLKRGRIDMIVAYGTAHPTVTVEIAGDTRETHLFLYSDGDRHWRLVPEPDTELRSVTVFGTGKAMVSGLPEGTDIFAMSTDVTGTPVQPCEVEDEAEQRLATELRHFAIGRQTLPFLEERLAAATGKDLSALVIMRNEASAARIDWRARDNTARLRETGARLQQALRPPVAFDISALPARMPEGLSGDGMQDWLLSSGAAIPVDEDLIGFLCLRERADLMALGFQTFHDPIACRARENFPKERQFILLRSLDVGDYYECDHDRGPLMHMPQGLTFTGSFTNCSAHVFPM